MTVRLLSSPLGTSVLRQTLSEHGIDIVAAVPRTPNLLAAAPEDAVVVDLRGLTTDTVALDRYVAWGRREAASKPLLFLCSATELSEPAIARVAATDPIITSSETELALARAIDARIALADQTDEAAIRLQALGALGLGGLTFPEHRAMDRALLYGDAGPEMLSLLGELGFHTNFDAALSRAQALQALETGAAQSFWLLAAKNRRPQAGLVKLVRRHSDLSALPVVVIEQVVTERHVRYWTKAGADLVTTPDALATAAAAARTAARRREAALSVADILQGSSFSDQGEACQISGSRYFETCLTLRTQQARRPFALAAIKLETKDGDPSHVSEPAVYISLALNSVDLIMRAAPDVLLISMPGTDRYRAAQQLRAFSALVSDLKFGTRERPSTFSARTAMEICESGDDPATMIRRVIAEVSGRHSIAPTPLDDLQTAK